LKLEPFFSLFFLNAQRVIYNYNLASGLVAFGLGVPEGAPIGNIIGGNLYYAALGSSLNVSYATTIGGQGNQMIGFSPKSILINGVFGAIGNMYSQLIGSASGLGNAFGDAAASPIIVTGNIVDQSTSK